MTKTAERKVMMTISVDPGTRGLIHKYGGQRGIGRLFTELIRQHDVDAKFGPTMVNTRLDRIEQRLTELLDGKGVSTLGKVNE